MSDRASPAPRDLRGAAFALRILAPVALFLGACGDTSLGPAPPAETPLDVELKALLSEASGGAGLDWFRLPASDALSEIPQDPANPLTPEKVALGRLLFHESALGVDNVLDVGAVTYSCASCHCGQAGFMANLPQGIGEGGTGFGLAGEGRVRSDAYNAAPHDPDVQPIRTPTVLNSAYQELMLWNGQFGSTGANRGTEDRWKTGTPLAHNFLGFEGVETQSRAGLEVHRLAGIDRSAVDWIDEYGRRFAAAFPGDPDPVDTLNAALAIAAYERTVLASRAPWQQWLRGDMAAMSPAQKLGAILFFGKANCVACHTGPALNSMTFHGLGMNDLDGAHDAGRVHLGPAGGTVPPEVRRGRGGFTGNPADDFHFKTPQLYNLRTSQHLGHGASFASVAEVVAYLNAGVPQNPGVPDAQLADELRPLGLSADEEAQLAAFIEEALYDPDVMRHVPLSVPSGACIPVNDAQGREDLGC